MYDLAIWKVAMIAITVGICRSGGSLLSDGFTESAQIATRGASWRRAHAIAGSTDVNRLASFA
jgi:hypothetical protein